jgi:phage gpG-like protein
MKLEVDQNSMNKVLDQFDKASEEIREKMYDELVITGLMIESDYKVNVLRDTGRLRSSAWTKHKRNKSYQYRDALGRSFDGALDYELGDNEVVVGTNVNYAIYVEERWKNFAFSNSFEKNTKGLIARLEKIINK